MQNRLIGYVRVSTREQNEERQIVAMRQFGVLDEHIIVDKQSGKDFIRPGWVKLKSLITSKDVLVIQSIDRLGRNYSEILEEWSFITKDVGAAIVVIDMPILDTRNERDLVGELISDIVLNLLSYVAETERAFIRKRQAEGIAAAQKRGVRFGREPLKLPDDYSKVYTIWKSGKISATKAAQKLSVSRNTFLKWTRKYDKDI